MALVLTDFTNNANNLTNVNTVADVTTSLPTAPYDASDHAAQTLAASSRYLSAPDASQLSVATTGKITFEAWVKVDALLDANYIFWKGVASNYEYEIKFGTSTGTMSASIYKLDGNVRYNNVSAASQVTTGVWYHMAVSVDDTLSHAFTNLRIYIDEVEKTNTHAENSANTLSNGTALLNIGRRTDTGTYGSFQITEVRIWNTIRSTTQLSDNKYRRLSGRETGLVAYYPFNSPKINKVGGKLEATINKTSQISFTGIKKLVNFKFP